MGIEWKPIEEHKYEYFEIGEAFTYKGIRLVPVEPHGRETCRDCFFFDYACQQSPLCEMTEREDGLNVIFKIKE